MAATGSGFSLLGFLSGREQDETAVPLMKKEKSVGGVTTWKKLSFC
jgi:hypothetical protein